AFGSRRCDQRSLKQRSSMNRIRLAILNLFLTVGCACAVEGTLTVSVTEESNGEETITRMELVRATKPDKAMPVRKTVPAGIGVVLDRSVEVSLPASAYQFRLIRGPEYRIITGNFTLDKTSLDEHNVALPRMINMLEHGWTSGDCCVPTSPYSLPLRMASEDLHVAATLGHQAAKPIAGRKSEEPLQGEPHWIREDVSHLGGLTIYGSIATPELKSGSLPVQALVRAARDDRLRVAVENPFAWALPVWLASGQVDGFFLMGDWLRLDRNISRLTDSRGIEGLTTGGGTALGRWGERVYWNLLEAGLRIPPLAGSGDKPGKTPVGYNRMYVAMPDSKDPADPLAVARVTSPEQWWNAAWKGQSLITNGPLMRPKLAGEIPGHVFNANRGEVLQLQPELALSVRDPVEYLEVILNGQVVYSARLDEFARAGGRIPVLEIKESSWVTIRVVTLVEEHFRAALTAPWYIDFDYQPRIKKSAVEFFQRWLNDYEQRLKQLPPQQLQPHVPYVQAARKFWAERYARSEP
ncbi:MAG: hypothetical protein VYA84_08725, partial [Planctomycetota bacterium]|nr:hypothetical protein [Planctomycetota bacterium]